MKPFRTEKYNDFTKPIIPEQAKEIRANITHSNSIDFLLLLPECSSALKAYGIHTISELRKLVLDTHTKDFYIASNLLPIPGIGRKRTIEIVSALAQHDKSRQIWV